MAELLIFQKRKEKHNQKKEIEKELLSWQEICYDSTQEKRNDKEKQHAYI